VTAIEVLSAAVRDRRVAFRTTSDSGDPVGSLRALPGIGAWTAQYIALRALGDADAFPSSDLGLRLALARRGVWRPWRGYAAMALWMSEGTR
jgi:3-methyladenine DNA glycosylase/8-oxoguanine DNA glycosylase